MKVTCPDCGDVEGVTPTLRQMPAGDWVLTFTCPKCGKTRTKVPSEKMIEVLVRYRCPTVEWQAPAEMADPLRNAAPDPEMVLTEAGIDTMAAGWELPVGVAFFNKELEVLFEQYKKGTTDGPT